MITDGRKTVTVAGTREKLSTSSVAADRLVLQAETDNTGVVVIGGSTVVAALATRRGVALAAGEKVELRNVDDLSGVWLDAMTSTDGVTWVAY